MQYTVKYSKEKAFLSDDFRLFLVLARSAEAQKGCALSVFVLECLAARVVAFYSQIADRREAFAYDWARFVDRAGCALVFHSHENAFAILFFQHFNAKLVVEEFLFFGPCFFYFVNVFLGQNDIEAATVSAAIAVKCGFFSQAHCCHFSSEKPGNGSQDGNCACGKDKKDNYNSLHCEILLIIIPGYFLCFLSSDSRYFFYFALLPLYFASPNQSAHLPYGHA